MWTEESLSEAMNVLLSAEQLEKVVTDEAASIVADGVSYTDNIYLKALDQLLKKNRIKSTSQDPERTKYQRVGS